MLSESIPTPARHRRRTRHTFNSSTHTLPLSSDDLNDGYKEEFGDEDEHVKDTTIPAIKSIAPLSPVLRAHLPPINQKKSFFPVPVRAVGFPDAKARRSGLQAKDGVRASGSGVLARRPSGRRWRAHPSDYDEVVARAHLSKPQVPPTRMGKKRVALYYTCEQIALFKLQKWMEMMSANDCRRAKTSKAAQDRTSYADWKITMYEEVLHLSFTQEKVVETVVVDDPLTAPALQKKHMLTFETGCCVFWGFTREDEVRYLSLLTPFSSSVLNQIDAQVMEYSYGDRSSIAKDSIVLCTKNTAEKIALSFAMAQSATLSAFETRVGDRIRSTKHIPSSLASVGSIRYSHNDTSKLIGQIFIELADVNIHSNVLDEPEYFFIQQNADDYKFLYEKMLKYQDVANRVAILNKRLSILRDLVGVLNQQLTHHQGSKLEWIIIWMLVFQVIIAIGWEIFLKDIAGYFHHG